MDKIGTILDEIVGKIADAFNPEKVIVFGSHAYGRPTEKSDKTHRKERYRHSRNHGIQQKRD